MNCSSSQKDRVAQCSQKRCVTRALQDPQTGVSPAVKESSDGGGERRRGCCRPAFSLKKNWENSQRNACFNSCCDRHGKLTWLLCSAAYCVSCLCSCRDDNWANLLAGMFTVCNVHANSCFCICDHWGLNYTKYLHTAAVMTLIIHMWCWQCIYLQNF